MQQLKVFVADIVTQEVDKDQQMDRMVELENLVTTYKGVVIVKTFQKKMKPDYRTYIWSGKLEEIKMEMKALWATLLVVWNILKPYQIYNINEELRKEWIEAWDRVDLILKIFERHAVSMESRLQIELAAIRHMGPRIFGMWLELSRQGWGWGTSNKWIWETNTERMKRHLQDRQLQIKKRLQTYENVRKQHRQSRLKNDLHTISIVGYTNAWKSSLMNVLTKKWVLAEDKLFATLWTHVGKMYIQIDETHGREYLLNDTIGFIRDLPPDLIEAFASTLEDSIQSQLLVQLIDSSDPRIDEKLDVVNDILKNIEANQQRIYVFNKIDLIDNDKLAFLKAKYEHLSPLFISTYSGAGLEDLKKLISQKV